MYLRNNLARTLSFDPRLDEPKLLKKFADIFPLATMCDVYGLNYDAADAWYGHLYEKIIMPNTLEERIQGDHIYGVLSADVVRNVERFRKWVSTSSGVDVFRTTKLNVLAERCDSVSGALLLAADTYCNGCGNVEPSFLYTDGQPGQYTDVLAALNWVAVSYNPEISGCISCNPLVASTYLLDRYARKKLNRCECVACRRFL